ncbi:MAG TPA: sulfurtransferase-like selenium metabolism protein YedF [Clostridiales bacterium]|nr:sulfurtransferase-like selenium metabolism protein YedF [Clostridiales bacterium]
MSNVVVNAVGDACPIPVVKTMKSLGEMTEGGIIEVHVDNETAVQNVMKFVSGKNLNPVSEKLEDNHFVIRAQVPGAAGPIAAEEEIGCIPDARGTTVIAFDSDTMGRGDDALGEILMKGFIYALSQLEELPKAMIFYNAGAKLTVEGSASLEDIKSLEAQGVEVLTCGTCLNFYGLSEKLAVGSVSNMYTIVEALSAAGKVIKP